MKRKRHELSSMKQRSLITFLEPKSPVSEQFRTIRTNIDFSLADRELSTIVITSSSPGEGKSTITANLATVMAQQGKKVLLVDADLRKPTVHYTFRQMNLEGLSNLLIKQSNIQEVITQTNVENLYIVTSGPIPPNPAELLSSKVMKGFISEAKQIFDVIIFDTPPVLAVTDAKILSSLVDGTILIVSSGHTEKDAVMQSKEQLIKSKAKILGVVLNRQPTKKGRNYYYYGE